MRQRRVTVPASFLWRHPAHMVALGFGSGLSPWAPGTVGTLWGWLAFVLIDPWLGDAGWALLLAAALALGGWAATVTARNLSIADPAVVVWDEIVSIWIVLWLLSPADGWDQLLAFATFRLLDATKPGPIGWADRRFKLRPGQVIGWRQGLGIYFDDLVAAACTLLVLAAAMRLPALMGLS